MIVVKQIEVSDTTAPDNEERYNNIDGSQKQNHKRKREFEGRKHYSLRSRNCDDSEIIKDADFNKVESQVIGDQKQSSRGVLKKGVLENFESDRLTYLNFSSGRLTEKTSCHY